MRFTSVSISTALVAALVVFPLAGTVSAQESLDAKLATIEKSLWEGWKNGDAKPFETGLTADSINITATGITMGKAQIIKDITSGDCKVASYSLADVKAHQLTKDSAMLTYKASQDAVCRGKKIPDEVYVSAVYVNQNGAWKAASYHETPVVKEKK